MKSRLMRWRIWFALGLVGVVSSFSTQADLLVNGGFEDPVVVGPYEHRNGNELPGWTLFSTFKGTVHFDTTYDPVSEGSQAVQIEVPGDWISQTFSTETGKVYTVSFDLSAYSVYGGPNRGLTPCNPYCDSILGVTVGPIYAEIAGSSASYVTNTLQFTADAVETTVRFENLYPGDSWGNYPHVDNVTVTVVTLLPGALEDLVAKVVDMNLQQGISNALDAKLDAAIRALDDMNEANDLVVVNALEAFIQSVEAQRDKHLTSAQADELVADAQAIIDELTNP